MKSKQILDVQQMRHLQEMGLELKDTMLYWIKPLDAVIGIVVGLENDWQLDFIDDKKKKYLKYIPAYTLQDVLDSLPKDISKDGCTWSASLYIDFESNRIAYGNTDRYGFEVYHEIMIEKDLIDAAYEMLCWCIENGYAKIGKEASDERADR